MEPLRIFTLTWVPLIIEEYKRKGGPSPEDFARAKTYAQELGEKGDALLFKVKGETGRMASLWLDGVAILSFVPGGVTIFDHHFEARGTTTKEEKCDT
jgi:hypothetical protein